MTEDPRHSRRPVSGTADIPSANSSNHAVVDIDDEQTMSIEELRIDYDDGATTDAVVEIYDDESSTTSGNESGLLDKFRLSPSDNRNPDIVYRDVEKDIIVTTGGNQDGVITVTVGGYIVAG